MSLMSLNTRFQTYGRNWKHKGLTGRKSCNSNQYARGLYSPDKNLAMLMLMLIIIDPCNYNLQNLQKVCEEWQFAKYSKNNPRCPNVLFRYCIVYFVFRSFPSLTNVTCALPYRYTIRIAFSGLPEYCPILYCLNFSQ